MSTNLKEYKERVKRLRSAVSYVLKVECTQSQAYELIAKEENYPNWDSLSGSIDKQSNEISTIPTLTNKEQIGQLFLAGEGLRNGFPFYNVLPFLMGQKNITISRAWAKVSINKKEKISEIFADTGFFSEEVLIILKMADNGGYLDYGIKSAIDFLKMD